MLYQSSGPECSHSLEKMNVQERSRHRCTSQWYSLVRHWQSLQGTGKPKWTSLMQSCEPLIDGSTYHWEQNKCIYALIIKTGYVCLHLWHFDPTLQSMLVQKGIDGLSINPNFCSPLSTLIATKTNSRTYWPFSQKNIDWNLRSQTKKLRCTQTKYSIFVGNQAIMHMVKMEQSLHSCPADVNEKDSWVWERTIRCGYLIKQKNWSLDSWYKSSLRRPWSRQAQSNMGIG